MLKIVNCVFGEDITIERRRSDEVTTIRVSRDAYPHDPGNRVRLSTEDQVDLIIALLYELPDNEKHNIIMATIESMPDHKKRHYAPSDKQSRRW